MPLSGTDYYNMVRGVGQSAVAGKQRGRQNALVDQAAARDQNVRNLLADYTMPGATPEARDEALNALMAADPAQASNVLTVEQQREVMRTEQGMQRAREGIAQVQFIAGSSDPVTALELLDEDGALRDTAKQLELDPTNPDDVKMLAGLFETRYTMFMDQASNALQDKINTAQANLNRPLTDDEIVSMAGGGGGTTINIGDKLNEPIPTSELANIRDPEGNTFPIGTTFAEARDAGGQVTTSSERDQQAKTESAMRVLDELEGMALGEGGVFEDIDRGFMNRAVASIEHGFDLLTQNDPGAARFNDMAAGTLAPIIKAMGEAGALADGDVQRALGLIPRTFPLLDTKDVAQGKFASLRRILRRGASNQNAIEQGQLPNLDPVLSDDDFSLREAAGTAAERARDAGRVATEIAGLGLDEFATAVSSMDLPALQAVDLDALTRDQLEALQDRLDALGF